MPALVNCCEHARPEIYPLVSRGYPHVFERDASCEWVGRDIHSKTLLWHSQDFENFVIYLLHDSDCKPLFREIEQCIVGVFYISQLFSLFSFELNDLL